MLSKFFLDRPVFAWVIAIIMMLAGGLALYTLPVSQYPPIAPPSIAMDAFYPGASAETVENSVVQIIEQKMTGFDKLLYMSATSDASGAGPIELTFAPGTDPDLAWAQVQNKLQLAMASLPEVVQTQGVKGSKSTRNWLIIVWLVSVAGFRSLLFATGRRLGAEVAGSPREILGAIDPKWNDLETWAAIRRAAGPATDFYLLAALDLRRDASEAITGAPPEQAVFRNVLGRTLWISGIVTLACLLLGYPVAYFIARQSASVAAVLLFQVLLPFWTSLLVRTVAWVVLLQREGILNSLMLSLGLVAEPVRMIFNRFAVYVAMVHVLLPFMVLPLYAVMKGIAPSCLRAASSLGDSPLTAFRRVYVPQTLPGVGAGVLMVFIQALGYYITPALVGGPNDQMVNYFVAFYSTRTINWGMAAALSLALLVATMTLYYVYDRLVGIDRIRMG